MNSRMDRYSDNTVEKTAPSRVSKNNDLYQEIKSNELTRIKNSSNVKIIENTGKTIDLEKIKNYIKEMNTESVSRRNPILVEETTDNVTEEETKKNYDLSSILEKAKETRELDYEKEKYKKIGNTEYDILNKLSLYTREEVTKNDDKTDFNTEERTLIDLINTVTVHKGDVNLLEELMGGETGEVTLPIEEEKEKPLVNEIKTEEEKEDEKTFNEEKTKELTDLKGKMEEIDNSFYTNSMKFSKEDFEGFDELEKSVKKTSALSVVILIILVLFIIATLVIISNYVFELGLF